MSVCFEYRVNIHAVGIGVLRISLLFYAFFVVVVFAFALHKSFA